MVSGKEIEELTCIANRLPEQQGQELLALISTWSKESRSARRVRYIEGVKFSSGRGLYLGKARDISTSGIFIETDAALEADQHVHMHLKLSFSPAPIEISGTVARQSPDGIAVIFNHENAMYKDLIEAILQ